MNMDQIERILNDGIILRARQSDVKEAIVQISKGNTSEEQYNKFFCNFDKVKEIVKKYLDKESPKLIYNHVIDLIEIYGLKKDPHFKELENISLG